MVWLYFIFLTYFLFFLHRGCFFLFPILHMVETPPPNTHEEIYLDNEMGCWMYPPRSTSEQDKIMVYFNGNAGNVSTRIANIHILQQILPEYRIYNLEYPGFGLSASLPLWLPSIVEECETACRHIIEKHPRMHTLGFWGESLGALVAAHVFSSLKDHVRWVVHMNGVASLHETIAEFVPPLLQALILPVLPSVPLDAVHCYQELDHQTIVLMHAKNDEVVSESQSQLLYLALKSKYPDQIHYLEWRGKHNSVLHQKENQEAVQELFETLDF